VKLLEALADSDSTQELRNAAIRGRALQQAVDAKQTPDAKRLAKEIVILCKVPPTLSQRTPPTPKVNQISLGRASA